MMVLAWTILLPLGILAARFFKVTRGQDWPQQLDNKRWWRAHLILQIAGVAFMSVGFVLVWVNTGRTAIGHSLHATLGWLVVLLGWLQLIAGYLRGSKGGPTEIGDHYSMTRRRRVFEWAHKLGGYAALSLSVVVTALGLDLTEAPLWMWLTIGLWWAALLTAAIRLQWTGRCIDTYQAIWGPDPMHPGNRRGAIGWGISRYSAAEYRRQFGPPSP
jgi:hypothetical protein